MKAFALVTIAALIPSSAFAVDPRIEALLWDSCIFSSASQFKMYAGPGVYHQVVTGAFFDLPVRAHQVRLRLTSSNVFGGAGSAPVADAWRFDAAGCEAGWAVAVPDRSEPSCPSLAPVGTTGSISSVLQGQDVLLIYDCVYPVQDPDPAQRYVLFGLDYDLTRAFPGPQSPPLCGGAEGQTCFVIDGGAWTDASGTVHPLDFQYFQGVSWQDQPPLGCFGDLPAEAATWGKLRALYR